jgi:hypothetical protein
VFFNTFWPFALCAEIYLLPLKDEKNDIPSDFKLLSLGQQSSSVMIRSCWPNNNNLRMEVIILTTFRVTVSFPFSFDFFLQLLMFLQFGGFTLVRNSKDLFESFGFKDQPIIIGLIIFQVCYAHISNKC